MQLSHLMVLHACFCTISLDSKTWHSLPLPLSSSSSLLKVPLWRERGDSGLGKSGCEEGDPGSLSLSRAPKPKLGMNVGGERVLGSPCRLLFKSFVMYVYPKHPGTRKQPQTLDLWRSLLSSNRPIQHFQKRNTQPMLIRFTNNHATATVKLENTWKTTPQRTRKAKIKISWLNTSTSKGSHSQRNN